MPIKPVKGYTTSSGKFFETEVEANYVEQFEQLKDRLDSFEKQVRNSDNARSFSEASVIKFIKENPVTIKRFVESYIALQGTMPDVDTKSSVTQVASTKEDTEPLT